MRWLLGLLHTIVAHAAAYCFGEDACLHPELEVDRADIESTHVDGRQWVLVLQCKSCSEKWSVKARTRHAF